MTPGTPWNSGYRADDATTSGVLPSGAPLLLRIGNEDASSGGSLVTDGTVTLKIAGHEYRLHEGDSVTFDADLPHHFVNPSKEEAVLLGVLSAGLRRS